jgi:hypothetical protein
MSTKASTIRMQNSLVMGQIEESKLTEVGNTHRLDYFGTRKKRAMTFENIELKSDQKSNLLRMNSTDSGQKNKMELNSPNDIKSYVHLIGYIDPLGMF